MRKAILGLAPLLLAFGASAAAQVPEWRVSEVSGDVRIVENGRGRAATRGALLASGSTIATAARARAVLVRGEEYVVVSPGSRLRVPDQPQGRDGIIQMLADWGTALFRIERQATPHFGVQTPYLAAVVKGTVFTVTVGEAGSSVQVTEGVVEVSTLDGGAVEMIRPGMLVSVSASDLQQLNIENDGSRSIRSNGTPVPGVVTIPAPQAGNYEGPSGQVIEIVAPVTEPAISLTEATGGLLDGSLGFELASADIIAQVRDLAGNRPAGEPVDGGTPPPAGGIAPPPAEGGATPPAGPPTPPAVPVDPPTQPPVDPPTLPVIPPVQPPVDPPTLPVDPPVQPPIDPPTLPVDPPVQPPIDPPTLPVDPPVQPPIDPPTLPVDPPVQPPIDPPTLPVDPPVQPPIDPPTLPVDPPVQPPIDPPTQPPVDDGGIDICLPGDLLCIGLGGSGGDPGTPGGPIDPPTSPPDDDDGGIGICLPGDLLCIGVGGPADDGDGGRGGGLLGCVLFGCRED
jgi:hypothetical protein